MVLHLPGNPQGCNEHPQGPPGCCFLRLQFCARGPAQAGGRAWRKKFSRRGAREMGAGLFAGASRSATLFAERGTREAAFCCSGNARRLQPFRGARQRSPSLADPELGSPVSSDGSARARARCGNTTLPGTPGVQRLSRCRRPFEQGQDRAKRTERLRSRQMRIGSVLQRCHAKVRWPSGIAIPTDRREECWEGRECPWCEEVALASGRTIPAPCLLLKRSQWIPFDAVA